MIATHCAICGRKLTNPISVRMGIGPICAGKYSRRGDLPGAEGFADGRALVSPMSVTGIYMRRADDGSVFTNVPHLVVHHSPTGFEWGYGGSGPSDLALNICEALLRQRGYKGERVQCYRGKCLRMAYGLHTYFRDQFIVPLPHGGGDIPYDAAQEWITKKMQELLLQDGNYV